MGRAGLFEIIAQFLHCSPAKALGVASLPQEMDCPGLAALSSMGLPGMLGSELTMALSCPRHLSHSRTQFRLEKPISYFSTDGSL